MPDGVKRDSKRDCAGGKVLSFPSRENLIQRLVDKRILPDVGALDGRLGPEHAGPLAELMRSWFTAGQTGCQYASNLAGPQQADLWAAQVLPEHLDDSVFRLVIDSATSQLGVAGILMLVFPYVKDEAGILELVRQVACLPDWWWVEKDPMDRLARVGLRWLLPDGKHVSWVLGFAPMPWLPFTRRAPVTALVLRVRPEAHSTPEEDLEDGLRGVHLAHLAQPMGERGESGGPVWKVTERRKRTLLWGDLSQDAKLVVARVQDDDKDDDGDAAEAVMGAAWNVLAPYAKAKVTFSLQRALVDTLPPPGRTG